MVAKLRCVHTVLWCWELQKSGAQKKENRTNKTPKRKVGTILFFLPVFLLLPFLPFFLLVSIVLSLTPCFFSLETPVLGTLVFLVRRVSVLLRFPFVLGG